MKHLAAFISMAFLAAGSAFAQETGNNINPFGSTTMDGRIKDFPKLKVSAGVASVSEIHEACGMSKWIWAIGAFIRIARHAATRDLRHEVSHTCGEYHGDTMPRYIDNWKQRTGWQPSADNVCTPEYEAETYQRLYLELRQAGWQPGDEEQARIAEDRARRGVGK